jgi:hypothetical protein
MAWFSFRLAMLKIGSRFSATHLPRYERAFERSLYRAAQILGQPFVIASTCESTVPIRDYRLIAAYGGLHSTVLEDLRLVGPAMVTAAGRTGGGPRLKADEVARNCLPFHSKTEARLGTGLDVQTAARVAVYETFSRQSPEAAERVARFGGDLSEGSCAVTHVQGVEHFIGARLSEQRERLVGTAVVAHREAHLSRGHRFPAV